MMEAQYMVTNEDIDRAIAADPVYQEARRRLAAFEARDMLSKYARWSKATEDSCPTVGASPEQEGQYREALRYIRALRQKAVATSGDRG